MRRSRRGNLPRRDFSRSESRTVAWERGLRPEFLQQKQQTCQMRRSRPLGLLLFVCLISVASCAAAGNADKDSPHPASLPHHLRPLRGESAWGIRERASERIRSRNAGREQRGERDGERNGDRASVCVLHDQKGGWIPLYSLSLPPSTPFHFLQ